MTIALLLTAAALALLVLWLLAERGCLLLPSTRRFLRLNGWRGLVNLRALHGYLYLRWQHRYAVLLLAFYPLARDRLRRWFATRYHSKVLTHAQAARIVRVDRQIPLQDLEHVIPYSTARRIVLSARPRLVAYECACRHARRNPCQPTQVCLFVGDPAATFMLEHHPEDALELTRDEALALLAAEHARGHVHTAWFKEALADRFYVICNCCSCCCAGIEVMKRTGVSFLASSGLVASLDPALCSGCGRCVHTCPFDAIDMVQNQAQVTAAACMGCGVCVDQCPNQALSLHRCPERSEPLEIDDLAQN